MCPVLLFLMLRVGVKAENPPKTFFPLKIDEIPQSCSQSVASLRTDAELEEVFRVWRRRSFTQICLLSATLLPLTWFPVCRSTD